MTYLKQQFDELLAYWPDENEALRSLRMEAFNHFNELGFPTKKWEEWQFTDFSEFKKNKYRLSWAKDLPNIPETIPGKIEGSDLVFIINGHYQSQISSMPDGVTIPSHLDVFEADDQIFSASQSGNPFKALNTAMMNSGIVISVAPNTLIKKPIQVVYLTTDLSDPLMNHPKFVFNVGENSQATIVEHYIGSTDQTYFVNPVSHVTVKANASFNHIRIQEENKSASHVATTEYDLEADSRLNAAHFSSGSKLFRHDIKLNFNDKGAEAKLNGLCLTESHQHHDQHVMVDHQNDACQSHQLFKYILADKSSGVFNGKVVVRENTKQTDADQSNKNLLLSPDALMNSNPQLEIYADDVKCAHGSTTGQIDPEALFYMRSRGISRPKATELIIGGFAKDVLDSISDENISDHINQKINNWLIGSQNNE